MVEVKIGAQTLDLPYTLRVYGVTETMFDEMVDEDTRAELLDGVMMVHSPATVQHDHVSGFLRALMSCYADEKHLGLVLGPDALVHLATCRKLAPDVFFVRQERVPTPLPKEFEGTPDVVVEVLSPSNRSDDLSDKRRAYHDAGVHEIWFVDTEKRQVIIDYRQAQDYVEEVVREDTISSTALTGFWIRAAWLWAEPLPNRMACLRTILDQ